MKLKAILSLSIMAIILLAACSEDLDTLSPGSTDGRYALGIKALVPLTAGNRWTYDVVLFDTAGAERARYTYTLSVKDTVTADTARIPLLPPRLDRKGLSRKSLSWYLLQGEAGLTTCWQVDTLENLRFRKSDDTLFYEQTLFNFRAVPGEATSKTYHRADTVTWGSGDIVVYAADSVKSTLVSKGVDTLRTTLGSSQYFQYRESYAVRPDYTDYYFKPGFGIILKETYQQTAGGRMVLVRRDKLASYYLRN